MKYMLLVIAIIALITQVTVASASQLNWDAVKNPDSPKFTFQRTMSIEYPDGGKIADALNGKQDSIHLKAKANSELVGKINEQFEKNGSHVRVSGVDFEYFAELIGHEHDASIDYKITMMPTMDGFLVREYKESSPALFDVSWRGIRLNGPTIISDGVEQIDINLPAAFLQKKFPMVYEIMVDTDVEKILKTDLIDASGLLLPLAKWHTLTDTTAVIADATSYGFNGNVVTTLSMGESTIINPTSDKISKVEFTSDKKYTIRTLEAADNANLLIFGYASPTVINQYEMIGASPKAPSGTNPNQQGQFPILVMYGMAGIAAVGAVGFFWWSNRKAKREASTSQTGIDPKHLRGVSTSQASGGYHTNRGESQLINEHIYNQTESVYEKQRRTMPKGWE